MLSKAYARQWFCTCLYKALRRGEREAFYESSSHSQCLPLTGWGPFGGLVLYPVVGRWECQELSLRCGSLPHLCSEPTSLETWVAGA